MDDKVMDNLGKAGGLVWRDGNVLLRAFISVPLRHNVKQEFWVNIIHITKNYFFYGYQYVLALFDVDGRLCMWTGSRR